ncbi:uncharacterized protein LOC104897093 [Beta vulgaris subsp. vulgaris]|uniref:uncharacterized protein LOC104897093 n=1 Tax=Beta vulgaris subsp. vulgaris TaxID=3555 RepID=UPI002036F486|nr:uncharacterized protein LOC104897093 [Beta vulgaris subsp. vulgaris]
MELEIKVMCCKGLTAFNFFQKLTLYAAVSITTENDKLLLTREQKQEHKTPVDDNGDGNPEWNYSIKFDLRSLNSINDLSLLFEMRNQGQLQFLWDKTIGEVRVPLTDLIQSGMPEVVRFVSYEVRNPEGKHNGILDFSYKVITNNNNTNHDNITGYHHHHDHQSHEHDANSDVHVIGYHHHNQELQLNEGNTQGGTYTETHMMGYQYHHHHYNHHLNESAATNSNSDLIQYPKIDLEEYNSTPLLVYPPPPSSSSSPSSSFSLTATTSAHYYTPAPAVYPPPSQQTWAEPPSPLSHYPPPQQHHVYPPPPQPEPCGDLHWGYYRPPGYHYW